MAREVGDSDDDADTAATDSTGATTQPDSTPLPESNNSAPPLAATITSSESQPTEGNQSQPSGANAVPEQADPECSGSDLEEPEDADDLLKSMLLGDSEVRALCKHICTRVA